MIAFIKKHFVSFFSLSCALFFFVALPVFAIDYTPLAPLDEIDLREVGLGGYLTQLFKLLIGVTIVLAVVMVVVGGMQYMLSEAITDKSAALKRIWSAVIGLVLISSSVLILQTINPELLKFNIDVFKITVPAIETPDDVGSIDIPSDKKYCLITIGETPTNQNCYQTAQECLGVADVANNATNEPTFTCKNITDQGVLDINFCYKKTGSGSLFCFGNDLDKCIAAAEDTDRASTCADKAEIDKLY
ncbi:MAG: hypothetical protein WD003_02200 [Candidatus Paceibacterota bacterium]